MKEQGRSEKMVEKSAEQTRHDGEPRVPHEDSTKNTVEAPWYERTQTVSPSRGAINDSVEKGDRDTHREDITDLFLHERMDEDHQRTCIYDYNFPAFRGQLQSRKREADGQCLTLRWRQEVSK